MNAAAAVMAAGAILLALALGRGSGGGGEGDDDDAKGGTSSDRTTPVPPSTTSPSSSSPSKKKKKKKSKGGGGGGGGENKKTPAKASAPTPPSSDDDDDEDGDRRESKVDDATAPATAAAAAGGKKKRIRKKKAKTSKSERETGSTKTASNDNGDDENGSSSLNTSTATHGKALTPAEWFENQKALRKKSSSSKKTASNAPDADGWVVEGPRRKSTQGKSSAPSSSAAPSATAKAVPNEKSSVVIDAKKVGIIIGPKGATMQAVEAATGAKLDVSAPSKDDGPLKANAKATVTVSGPPDAVRRAMTAVRELADKGYTVLIESEGFTESGIMVHPRYLSEIVGPKGSIIRSVQDKLGVKLTIPPTDWNPKMRGIKTKEVRVGIAGPKEACVKAKACLQSLVRYHHHEVTHPGLIHQEVNVPSEFLHCVVGPRGSEIRHIRGNYGCDVYVPDEDSYVEDNVIVVGRRTMVDKAIVHIMNLMDRDTEVRERQYDDDHY